MRFNPTPAIRTAGDHAERLVDADLLRIIPLRDALRPRHGVQTDAADETCCHGEGRPKVAIVVGDRRGPGAILTVGVRSQDLGWACEDCLGEADGAHPHSEIIWLDADARDRINAEYAAQAGEYTARHPSWPAGRRFCQFLADRTAAKAARELGWDPADESYDDWADRHDPAADSAGV